MLMLSLNLTKLPISGWRLLLTLLRMTQQQTVLNVFKRSSQNASPPVAELELEQHQLVVPQTHPLLKKVW